MKIAWRPPITVYRTVAILLAAASTRGIVGKLAAQSPRPIMETQPIMETGPAADAIAPPESSPATTAEAPSSAPADELTIARRNAAARDLISRTIEQLAFGPAFDAKIRQRTWVGGREVVGVGSYEQAGRGSGHFNLQITMHDGDGKHSLQQVSDGRLAWTRQQIGGDISLRRVDVGRLDQWVKEASHEPLVRSVSGESGDLGWWGEHDDPSVLNVRSAVRPSVRVGGWTELLDKFASDHRLTLVAGTLDSREVWIVTGHLRDEVRQQARDHSPEQAWPVLYPTKVVVAIARTNDLESKFGQGLPLRMEFWTDPVVDASAAGSQPAADAKSASVAASRLVSLLEVYSVRPISPPPVQRFRFDNQDAEVNFVNETDRYLTRYGIRLTERQSRELRR